MSKIIPNSFQIPNCLVDDYMRYLSGDEVKCYALLARKILGWQKDKDRIATSQIMEKTGLQEKTIRKVMSNLVAFGLVLRVSENNAANHGTEWALQLDDTKINEHAMIARGKKQDEANAVKLQKARNARKVGGVVPQPPIAEHMVGGAVPQCGGEDVAHPWGGDVPQRTQKPLSKATIKKVHGAQSAPRAFSLDETTEPSPKDQNPSGAGQPVQALQALIETYPADVHNTLIVMLKFFPDWPVPCRPAPNEPAGEYGLWINDLRALNQLTVGYDLDRVYNEALQRWTRQPFEVKHLHPGSLRNYVVSIVAQFTEARKNRDAAMVETPLMKALQNYKPRPA